ncbi:MAG: glycosyltransferase family 4 protein, partial [Saprospiraceae bacterium]
MRVLFLANELRYTDGVTTHLLNLTGGLSKRENIELFIICGGGNGTERFNNINVKVISDERFLHDNRSMSNYLFSVNHLRKFVKENKIDIVHSHSHYGANIAYDTEKITSTKTVQTNHGLLQEEGK